MTCRKAERWLLASFDRDLPGPSREALTRHLGVCAECRKRAAEYGDLRKRLGVGGIPEPLPRFWERLETRIAESRPADPAAVWARLWVRAIPVSLSLIAGFLIATLFFLPAGAELTQPEALLLTEENPITDTRPFIEEGQREVRDLMILFASDERIVGKR
jgi:anti-sigma factor RsiW